MHVLICFLPIAVAGLLTVVAVALIRLRHPDLTDMYLFARFKRLWWFLIVMHLAAMAATLALLIRFNVLSWPGQ